MRTRSSAGFTLIELLIVIAIIGLLSTLAVLALNNARIKSRDTVRAADIKQIQTALELYFNERHTYPVIGTAAAPITLGTASTDVLCATATGFDATCAGTVYMGVVPAAPSQVDGACTAANSPYRYFATVSDAYTIGFCLGAQTGALGSGPRSATNVGIQ